MFNTDVVEISRTRPPQSHVRLHFSHRQLTAVQLHFVHAPPEIAPTDDCAGTRSNVPAYIKVASVGRQSSRPVIGIGILHAIDVDTLAACGRVKRNGYVGPLVQRYGGGTGQRWASPPPEQPAAGVQVELIVPVIRQDGGQLRVVSGGVNPGRGGQSPGVVKEWTWRYLHYGAAIKPGGVAKSAHDCGKLSRNGGRRRNLIGCCGAGGRDPPAVQTGTAAVEHFSGCPGPGTYWCIHAEVGHGACKHQNSVQSIWAGSSKTSTPVQ